MNSGSVLVVIAVVMPVTACRIQSLQGGNDDINILGGRPTTQQVIEAAPDSVSHHPARCVRR
jgi:hypothetical protein